PVGDGDLDIVLVRRQLPTPMHELLEHRGRVVRTGVDHRAGGRVPTPRIPLGSGGIEYRMSPLRIAYAIAGQHPIEDLCGHAADPYSRRPRISRTSCAPSSFASAMSIGGRPLSNGCGRRRKSLVWSSVFQTRFANDQISASRAIFVLCTAFKHVCPAYRAKV